MPATTRSRAQKYGINQSVHTLSGQGSRIMFGSMIWVRGCAVNGSPPPGGTWTGLHGLNAARLRQ
jgi:hypothetical protein